MRRFRVEDRASGLCLGVYSLEFRYLTNSTLLDPKPWLNGTRISSQACNAAEIALFDMWR